MIGPKKALRSSLGQKILMALSGLGLMGFLITHLAGNLTLLSKNPDLFNRYAKGLLDLGPLLIIAEVGLLSLALLHIVTAVRLKLNHSKAKPIGYNRQVSKGGPSLWNAASMNMIITGSVLLVFLVLHILHFKFGPGLAEGYATIIDSQETRDLHRLVIESFQDPKIVVFYTGVMILLMLHLRHGFWSAFQSLGLMKPEFSRTFYCFGFFIALLLAGGFTLLPIYLYFMNS